MDVRSLEVFLILSEELHFGRAAERLAMSQSSVSEHLRRLERRIGRSLFERTSRRVVLTEVGEILSQRLRDPVGALRAALREAEKGVQSSSRTLRVGFLGGGFYELHEPVVRTHRSSQPDVALEFVELNYETQFSAILNGDVDVGYCRLPVGLPGLDAGPIIMSDPRVVCLGVGHRLAGRAYIDAEELGGETMLRVPVALTGRKWAEYNFPLATPERRPLHMGPVIRTVREGIAAVIAGSGIFFITKRAAQYYATPRVAFIEVNLPPIHSALCWKADDRRQIVKDFNQSTVQAAHDERVT